VSSRPIRVAVVGGGAAAVGVLSGLKARRASVFVTQIDLAPGRRSEFEPTHSNSTARTTATDLETSPEFIAHLRKKLGWKFPPPKSHFGVTPETLSVTGWGSVWSSNTGGGLTRFWGASALPYPDAEFADWPISAAELRAHYQAVVDEIPVCGTEDALSALWGGGLSSRPALKRSAIFDALEAHLAQRGQEWIKGSRFIGGSGRMAIETNPEAANVCRLIGSCMSGCPRDAVFSAEAFMARASTSRAIDKQIIGRVLTFDPARKTLAVESGAGVNELGPFDLILLAAGCIGSTAIALRSLPAIRAAPLQDNSLYTFPLCYLRRAPRTEDQAYFALTNFFVACQAHRAARMSVVQIYPFFDLLWQYYVPSVLWPMIRPLGRGLRAHVAIARLYVTPEYSQAYRFTLDAHGEPILALERPPCALEKIPGLWTAIRTGLSGNGFWVPPAPKVLHRTSSHYAGTLPLASAACAADGSIATGVYVCDSAAFPRSSAFSPTLTIMAYARRTTVEALKRQPLPA
jgi:hypothetical protein